MKRTRVFLAQVGVICTVLGLALPMAKAEDEATATNSDSAVALKKCVSDERSLSVLFLVDVSSSMISGGTNGNGSDPKGLRADTLKTVIELLHTPAEMAADIPGADAGDKSGLDVETAFLDFGTTVRNSFEKLSGWHPIEDVFNERDLIDQFKKKYNDQATDYVRALAPQTQDGVVAEGEVGAIEMMNKAKSPCRILMWLTDGKFALGEKTKVSWDNTKSPYKRIERGTEFLCKKDPRFSGEPLVDQLRKKFDGKNQIFVGAVGLGSANFNLFKSIAEGGECGSLPASGKFVLASEPQGLIDALTQLVLPTVDPPKPAGCIDSSKPENESIFHLNEVVERVNVLVRARIDPTTDVALRRNGSSSGGTESEIELVDNGQIVNSPPPIDGVSEISVKRVFQSGLNSYLLFQAKFDSSKGNFSGDWFTEFCRDDGVNDDVDKSTIFVYGGVSAELVTKELTAERTEEIVIQLKSRGGSNLQDTSKINFQNTLASVDGKNQTVRIEPDGRAVISYKPKKAEVDSTKKIAFSAIPTLKLTDGSNGVVAFDPIKFNVEAKVRDVPKTPSVIAKAGTAWGRLAKGALSQERIFVVKPGEEDGAICFGVLGDDGWRNPTDFVGTPNLKISGVDKENCVSVKKVDSQGKEVKLAVGVVAKQLKIQTNSQIQFEMPYVASTSSGEKLSGKLETQSVPIDSALSISMQWFKAILYLLLAVLIPICLLWMYNAFIGCRLVVPDRGIFVYQKKLILDDNRVHVDPSFGSGAVFQAGDMKLAPVGNGRVRKIALANLSVKGKFSWLSPFSAPFAEASNNNDRQVIGPDGASIKSRVGFSPLAIEDVWYVQIDSGKTTGVPDGSQAIDLVVLVSNPLDGARAVDDAVKKARTRISEFKSELAEAERSEKGIESEKRSRREPEIAEEEVKKPSVWLLGKPESGKAEKATIDSEDDNGPKRRFSKFKKPKDQVDPDEVDPPHRIL
jgi:hypothetical protein